MTRRRPLSAQRVFFAARRVRGERRAAFVERVCRENEELRAQVAALLARDDPSTDFLRPATRVREALDGLDGPGRWATELSGRLARRGPPLEAGVRIAERYAIEALIGEGSSGRVYRARDEVLRTVVAVKVLDLEAGEEIERLRREAATLRWLRVPGVVNLQDDGVDEGRPYIVTDLVDGTPFPGACTGADTAAAPATSAGPRRWDDIRETAVGLLETLARIHAQGVIHGDLKPANVLVDAKGIPTVLDVGIASGPSIDFGESEALFAGTPSYMAPERIGGAPASVATDLYAVGVMLHQALAGAVPHHARSRTELLDRRRMEPAPAIATLADGVPADVARMIDALVAREAKDRPASAYDALDLLEHRRYVRPGDPDYPWLGSRELIDKLVQAAKEGRSMDIWGPPGSGKTRTLKEAAKELEALGRKVVWLFSSSMAASDAPPPAEQGVVPSCGAPPDPRARVADRIAAMVAAGWVVVVDVSHVRDQALTSALTASRGAGVIWRARRCASDGATRVPRLKASDLERLFAGHSRLLHVPEDAAAELHARTAGVPGRALAEAASWVRSGIATWAGQLVRIDRDAIRRLALGRSTQADRPSRAQVPGAEFVGRPSARIPAERSGRPVDPNEMLRRGLDRILELSACSADSTIDEAVADFLGCALGVGTARALDVASYALARCRLRSKSVDDARSLVRAALATANGSPQAALLAASSLAPPLTEHIEAIRTSVEVMASRALPIDVEERTVAAVANRLAGLPGIEGARVLDALGWLRYRQGRFAESARLHRRRLDSLAADDRGRLAAMCAAASAHLEADELVAARELALAAVDLAAALRDSIHEARGVWVARAACYRLGEPLSADVPLARAAGELGHPTVSARIHLQEAAIAWRASDKATCAWLAAESAARWGARSGDGRAIALALEAASAGVPLDASAAAGLLVAVRAVRLPGVAIQSAALAALANPTATTELLELARVKRAELPGVNSTRRREVLSIHESFDILTNPAPTTRARAEPDPGAT